MRTSPGLVRHAGAGRVHRWLGLELLFVLGVVLIVGSDALGLYQRVALWGKFVHGVEGALATAIVALLLLGYRDRVHMELPLRVAALVAIFAGITFGALWEFLEFFVDWIRYSDLQSSNTDTMTDMLWNDLGAVVATLIAFHAYSHWLSSREREDVGASGERAFSPPSRLIQCHGRVVFVLALLAIAGYVAALWYSERALPFL